MLGTPKTLTLNTNTHREMEEGKVGLKIDGFGFAKWKGNRRRKKPYAG